MPADWLTGGCDECGCDCYECVVVSQDCAPEYGGCDWCGCGAVSMRREDEDE